MNDDGLNAARGILIGVVASTILFWWIPIVWWLR